MLDPNEATRIDVEGIRQHPWFRSPMGPQLQEAIEKMEAEQAANEVRRCIWTHTHTPLHSFRIPHSPALIRPLRPVASSNEGRDSNPRAGNTHRLPPLSHQSAHRPAYQILPAILIAPSLQVRAAAGAFSSRVRNQAVKGLIDVATSTRFREQVRASYMRGVAQVGDQAGWGWAWGRGRGCLRFRHGEDGSAGLDRN